MDGIRLPQWTRIGISSVCKALLHSLPHIRNHLAWRINDGTKVCIGLDPWIEGGGRFQLPRELILHLNQRDISVIAQITDQENTTIFAQAWKSAIQLHIPPH